jgi:membrane protease YdiL (CAAX protease family)
VDVVVFALSFASIAAAVFLLASRLDRKILASSALICAVYLGLDDFATGLPSVVPNLDFLGGQWNWAGKVLSLALSVAAIRVSRLNLTTVGLTLDHRNTKIGVIALVLLTAWGACLGLIFEPGRPDAETLAFQATMPSLSEELAYRGIAPAILLGLMHRRGPVIGVPWAVILATSVVFGVWHGLRYSDGSFGFDAMSALFPFVAIIPAAWLRFKTGSLLYPILGHSLANVAFHVAGGLSA